MLKVMLKQLWYARSLTTLLFVKQAQLHQFFPMFMWLVRDFSLVLETGGKQISANEYLRNALQPVKVLMLCYV